jgi:hypothetical protein
MMLSRLYFIMPYLQNKILQKPLKLLYTMRYKGITLEKSEKWFLRDAALSCLEALGRFTK